MMQTRGIVGLFVALGVIATYLASSPVSGVAYTDAEQSPTVSTIVVPEPIDQCEVSLAASGTSEPNDCDNQWLIDSCKGVCTATEDACGWACGAAQDTCEWSCGAAGDTCGALCGAAEWTCVAGCDTAKAACYASIGVRCWPWDSKCQKSKAAACDRARTKCVSGCQIPCEDCQLGCKDECAIACDDCRLPCERDCEFSCKQVGDSCVPIDPGFGERCAEGLSCMGTYGLVTDNVFTCVPGESDTLYPDDVCLGMYSPTLHKGAIDAGTTMSYGLASGFGAVIEYSQEMGAVYGQDGRYGCYVTNCTGGTSDVEVSGGGFCHGQYTSLDDFMGQSDVFVEEAGEVIVFSTMQVTNLSDGRLIGNENCLSLELSLLPVSASVLSCATSVKIVGELDNRGELVAIGSSGNSAPVLRSHLYAAQEDVQLVEAAPGLLFGSSDPDGGPLIVIAVDDSRTVGSVSWAASGAFTYNPAGKFESLAESETGTDSFSYTVEDGDGNTASAEVAIAVRGQNDAPTDISHSSPDIVAEGARLRVEGGFVDVDESDAHVVTVHWGDGTVSQPYQAIEGKFAAEHRYADDNPSGTPADVLVIQIVVTDTTGAEARASIPITVDNVAPVVAIDEVADGRSLTPIGIPVEVSARFSDVGVEDTHVATIDWGDGATTPLGEVADGVSGTHGYSAAGGYVIAITVVDDDTGATTETIEVEIRDAADMSDGVADQLAGLLDGADAATLKVIQGAIDDLIGNKNGRASNGAEDHFRNSNSVAALGALAKAAAHLEGIDELDVTGQLVLLALTAQSVAEAEAAEARETAGCTDLSSATCSRGERKKVTTVEELLAAGRGAIATGDYVEAIEAFKDAVQRS